MAYTAPDGDDVGFALTGDAWLLPDGELVFFEVLAAGSLTQYTSFIGIGDLAFGIPAEARNVFEYVIPSGVGGLRFGKAWLAPGEIFIPSGTPNLIGFQLDGTPWSPPDGNEVGFSNVPQPGELLALGFDALASGATTVINALLSAHPVGIYELQFGQHAVITDQYLTPVGMATLDVGLPLVANESQGALVSGVETLAMGLAGVINLNKHLDLFGFDLLEMGAVVVDHWLSEASPAGPDLTEWGDAWVSNEIRRFDIPGLDAFLGGLAIVSNELLYVQVIGVQQLGMGPPTVGYHVELALSGFDASAFGLAEVIDNRQTLPVSGFTGLDHGLAEIRRATDRVESVSVNSTLAAGEPYVINLNMRLGPVAIDDGGVPHPLVLNYDREIRPAAFESLRIPYYHDVTRTVPLQPAAFATEAFGATLVSNQIRSFDMTGFHALTIGEQRAELAAQSFTPPGVDHLQMGLPGPVWSNLQTIRDVRIGETWALGAPFVSYRIRTLGAHYISDSAAGRPLVRTDQILYPLGFDSYRTSTTDIRDKMRRLTVNVGIFAYGAGAPALANRNRHIYPFGADTSDIKPPVFELGTRTITVPGMSTFVYSPGHRIEFLDRTVSTVSWTGRFGNGTVALFPQPPAQQHARPLGVSSDAFGDALVQDGSVYPLSIASLVFGTANVRGTLIEPQGIQSLDHGLPTIVMAQYVTAIGRDSAEVGRPSMSPQTIWAPYGAPLHAIDNHNNEPGNVIAYLEYPDGTDRKAPNGDYTTWFGDHVVSNQIRTVVAIGRDVAEYGLAQVTRTGPIYLFVNGFLAYRVGFHDIDGPNKTRTMVGFDALAIGEAAVAPPPTLDVTLPLTGFDATQWGDAWLSTRPQDIWTLGADTAEYGGVRDPFYSGLWVSREYDPFPAQGVDTSEFGVQWISNEIRYFAMDGFEALLMVDTQLASRASVSGRYLAHMLGADLSAMGTPGVTQGTRVIAPGSVFHHWVIPAPTVRGQTATAPGGFDGHTIGALVIDGVEPGIIKGKGSDLAEIGRAVLNCVIYPGSFVGEIGDPRVSSRIEPTGIAGSMGHGVPTSTGHTCGMAARAAVPQSMDALEFGEVTVG